MGAKERWLGRVSGSTARTYENRFDSFISRLKENEGKFSEMTPDELVSYQINSDNGSRYDLLDLVQEWVAGLDLRYSSKQTSYRVILSFFRHNRAELPSDPTFRLRSDTPPVNVTLSVEDVRDAILSSNKTYQTIFTCMFQGGMDLSSFDYWNKQGWASLRDQLRQDPDVIRIDLPGRKRRRNREGFYTFIGRDAVVTLANYLPHRIDEEKFAGLEEKRKEWCKRHNKEWEPKEYTPGCIFYNQFGNPIHKGRVHDYWLNRMKRLGKVKPVHNGGPSTRYGKNIHELRDLFRSQWEKSPAKGVVAEFCMGHAIDPLGYNKAVNDMDWTKGEYLQAMPMLQIMSSGRPFGQVDETEVDRLKAEVERLRETKDDRIEGLEEDVREMREMLRLIYEEPELAQKLKKHR